MNIETVNELIQSLESADELSIREQKFLKLAKAYQQLAAENVGLKKFIKTECFVGQDKPDICPGLVSTRYVSADGYEPETPATDRIVAGIKADAITASLDACSDYLETDCVMDRLDISYEEAEKRTSGAMEFHDSIVAFAQQLREGDGK